MLPLTGRLRIGTTMNTSSTQELIAAHPLQRLLTLEDLCQITQTRQSTMYSLLSAGKGPRSMKIGRNLRFSPTSVLEWFDALSEARSSELSYEIDAEERRALEILGVRVL